MAATVPHPSLVPAPATPAPPSRRRARDWHGRAIRDFKRRLRENRFVTLTVHNDDALWGRMLEEAAKEGFEPVPNSMVQTIVNPVGHRIVVSHVAHLMRVRPSLERLIEAAEARSAIPPPPPYCGVEFA